MGRALGLANLCIIMCVTGCSIVPQRYRLAAEPLMDVPPNHVSVPVPGSSPPARQELTNLDNRQRVNLLVQDSQNKCADFVDSMFAQTAGSGFILDILSTGTSAIATIFTPLATVHSLAAASTIFGAAKTGISANYLNTLSISHITQAIQQTYSTNMKIYVDSLATADPAKIDVFQERSKIASYHAMCSLAAAEGSISSTLQATPQAGQGLTYRHTVAATENSVKALAADLVSEINDTTSGFSKAAITALQTADATIKLNNPNAVPLTVVSSPISLVQWDQGTGILTISEMPKPGNTISITRTAAAQQSTAGQTAPAAAAAAALR